MLVDDSCRAYFPSLLIVATYKFNINVDIKYEVTMERTSIINYDALWSRISEYAIKAGRVTIRPILLLFYVMKSKETPWKDKMLIFTTLSYIVFPIDILDARRLPIIGWFDEIASLSVTCQKMRKNITPEIEKKVDILLDKWFPQYGDYIELPA